MVMVLVGGGHALVADHRLARVHALHQAQTLQLLKDAVDARPADAALARTQGVLDLERRQRAGLGVEQLQQRASSAAAPMARSCQRRLGALDPRLAGDANRLGGRGRAHEAMVETEASA
jgi:hypothetical protein